MSQLHVVKCIQEVASELHVLCFSDHEILHQSNVGVRIAWTGNGSLRRTIAKGSLRRFRIAIGVHPDIALESTAGIDALLASKNLLWTAVRSRSARTRARGVGGVIHGQRKAAVKVNNRRSLPAAHQCVCSPVHVSAEPLTSANGESVGGVCRDDISGVVVTAGVIAG